MTDRVPALKAARIVAWKRMATVGLQIRPKLVLEEVVRSER